MAVNTRTSTFFPRGTLYGLGLAVLWVVLALASPTTTYHLAPLLVAGTPTVADSLEGEGPKVRLVSLAALGLILALAATGILAILGSLEGPSLLPIGGAALESAVFALVGSLAGIFVAAVTNRR